MNIFLLVFILHVVYCKIVKFNDSEIQYFGRWEKTSQDIQSISSGAYLKTTTNSKKLVLILSQPATIIIQLNKQVLFKKHALYEGVLPIELPIDISPFIDNDNHTLTFVSDIQSSIHLQAINLLDHTPHLTTTTAVSQQDLIEFVGHDLTLGLGTSKSMMTSFPWLISNLLGTERSQIAFKSAWLINHPESLGIETLYFKGESFYSPRIVTVLLGEYDQWPQNYTLHLFQFLSSVRHQFPDSILFVLSEPLGVLFHESQEAVHLMEREDQNVYFIDTTGWIRYGTEYYHDPLHLNDKGQELFANKLSPILRSKLINEPLPPSDPPNPNLPYHWQTMDIGAQDDIGLTGSVSFDSQDIFTLWGSGSSSNDSSRYVYQPLSGIGSITVTLVSHTCFDACAKAGIVLREHLAPHAPQVMLGYSPERGLFLSSANKIYKTQKTTFHKVELQLKREQAGVAFYVNKALWYTLQLGFARDVYVGMSVSSCNSHVVSVAKFSDVSIEQSVSFSQHSLIIQQS